jgi:Flp pilus assembly protein TadD
MAKAYSAMGVSYDKLRENSQAIHCYQLALKIDSNLDYVHNNLGYSYLNIGNPDAAIESFQKAIQLNDENKRYRNNLALAYVMNDRYDRKRFNSMTKTNATATIWPWPMS